MPGGYFDSGFLKDHNHSSDPGDGGKLSNLSILGTLSTTGQINSGGDLVFSNTALYGVRGTTTNDSAPAGKVGEYKSAGVAGAGNLPATNTYGDASQVDLTAGDWMVSGFVIVARHTATWITAIVGLSNTPGNSSAGLTNTSDIWVSSSTTPEYITAGLPPIRFSLAAPATIYLKILSQYTAGQPQTDGGGIFARRVR